MVDITQEVRKTICEYPSLQVYINFGIINIRALAKHIIKTRLPNTPLDIVMKEIKPEKYQVDAPIFERMEKSISETLVISTKSHLAYVALLKDKDTQKIIPQLFSIVHYNQGDVLRVVHADESIKIIADGKNLSAILKYFPKEKIISVEKNLAEINVHLHPKLRCMPGLIATVVNELMLNGINIREVMSCYPEWLILMDEGDLLTAYEILYKLCDNSAK